jgi:Zn-dependent protease
MNKIIEIILQLAVFAVAISVHESAHAWMADRLGDPTARYQGRISLNPIRHIDPIGTIIFPVILAFIGGPVFGWAKPVPVDPYNFRNPRKDNLLVSAAGPVSNILTATAGILVFLILKDFGIINLSGYAQPGVKIAVFFFLYLILINIFLAIFNLIPVPPLDGSGILEGVLSGEALRFYEKMRPYGFIILLAIIYTGALNLIADPIFTLVINILRG